jgi:hypothetical protein
MIGPGLDGSLGALDPNWDRARELHAKYLAAMEPFFHAVDDIFSDWPLFSREQKAHHREQFFAFIATIPAGERFILADLINRPSLPTEIRHELEAML